MIEFMIGSLAISISWFALIGGLFVIIVATIVAIALFAVDYTEEELEEMGESEYESDSTAFIVMTSLM